MIYPNVGLEKKLFNQGYQYLAAIDEVGRGAWAGPLIAVAVIADLKFPLKKLGVKDSKLLTEIYREKVFKKLAKQFIWSAGLVNSVEIDQYGLTWANYQAVLRALANLPIVPDYLLVDYLHGFNHPLPHQLIIDGDYKIMSIALASIFAKVTRDRLMNQYHKTYPQYYFTNHKGYGTALHKKSIEKYGLCPLHRRSFLPIINIFRNSS